MRSSGRLTMATRTRKSPPLPATALTAEQTVWLANFIASRIEVALTHDGRLTAEAAAHLAAEKTEAGVAEFYRKFK